jgi:hypothetical protein
MKCRFIHHITSTDNIHKLHDSNHVEGIRAETWITLRGFEPRLESRWGDSSRKNYMTRITLRGFEPRLESRWGDSSRDLNHVEGIQVGKIIWLESRWGDSSRKNYMTWITLRGFEPRTIIWLESRWGNLNPDLNHVERVEVGKMPRLQSCWEGWSRKNVETWATLRGFKSEKF